MAKEALILSAWIALGCVPKGLTQITEIKEKNSATRVLIANTDDGRKVLTFVGTKYSVGKLIS